MKRREFITLLGGAAAAWPLVVRAQAPKMLRVGYSGMLPREAPHYAAFEKRMAELGYQEHRNFTFEFIQAPSIEGYERTYRELAARNVDILLAAGNEPANYSAALMPLDQSPGEPVMIPASPLALRDRIAIAHLLLKRGTPSICAFREVMEAGALMSYGVNLVDVFRDIAAFVDQVARGGKAGDVPMRAPSHFHTAFNLKTAKALGLEMPPMLLARADEVIE